MEKAKIAIIQFQLSAPKPDVRDLKSEILVTDHWDRWTIRLLSMIIGKWIKSATIHSQPLQKNSKKQTAMY